MSSLDKLGIRGIRAFDDKEINVIQFYHPLTVIVGHNGSGKTTIIECLKYITTGDMPPNTKGGAFIHDPNMAGETEVKAEVRLRFMNTNGDRMTATRRLQVTKKKTALSMKTLEGVLSFTDQEDTNTKRTALSSKCSDLDEEIPRLLGVSKAILENVIFCHQEDSNWPLSEPSVLKKKFDDIFEATKYTKALDQIKTIRKEQTAETKVDKERLLALKTDRERAVKVQATISKLEKSIAQKSAEEENLVEYIKQVTDHNRSFYEKAVEHTRILNEVRNLEVEKNEKKKTIESLRNSMNELPGSRQELENRRDNFAREAEEQRQTKHGFNRELQAAEDEHHRRTSHQSSLVATRGGLEAEQKSFKRALYNRQNIVKTLASQYDIKGFDVDPLEESQITEFRERLEGNHHKAKKDWEDVKENNKKAEEEKRNAINAITSEQQSNRAIRADIKKQQDRVKAEIDEVLVQIDNSRSGESDVLAHKQKIQDAERRLASATEDLKAAAIDETVNEKRRELKQLEAKRDDLHTEISGLNTQADTRAKLALKRSDATKKEEILQNMVDNQSAAYRKHVQHDLDKERMLETVKIQITRVSGEINMAEKASAVAQKDLNQVESKLGLLRQQKVAAEKEASENEQAVEEQTEGQEIDKAIEEAEAEIRDRETTIEQLNSAVGFYQRVIDHGQKEHMCIACSRGLTDADLPKFKAYCKKQIEDNPRKIAEAEDDLPGWRDVLNGLRKVQPLVARAAKLRSVDIPKYEAEMQDASSKNADIAAKAEETHFKVAELKASLRELESLRLVASDVQRLLTEISDLKRDIEYLEGQLQSSGTSRTADDVQVEIQQLGESISSIKKDLDRLGRDKERLTGEIRASETEISRAQIRLTQAEQKASLRTRALADKEKLDTEKQQLQERLDAIDRQIRDSDPASARMRKDFRTLQDTHRETEAQAQTTMDNLARGLNELRVAVKTVQDARKQDIKSKLKDIEAKIKAADSEIRSQVDRMATLREEIAALEKKEANSKQMERNVDDNIRYRMLKEEVKEIEMKIAGKDLEGANKAKERFDKDYEQGRRKLQELQAQQAKITGELAMSKSTLDERRAELESEYKDVQKLYTRQLIKVKTAEFAVQDLEKYGKALDNAIMKYHGHKMMEINDTARALWNKCYQGTDIDTIMIKSDSEGAAKVGNRTYNYRVVMVKDSVELDMRGRCSAGQKVLASIIVRLALAESFGTNCGVLALDEPTTNLDRDNILALAEALADIIKERRAQSNFQLIVITHDEEFLTALGTSGAVEKYWRVSRNARQKSTIERQRLDQH